MLEIEFVQVNEGQRGRRGYYVVKNWGVINPEQFKQSKEKYCELLRAYRSKNSTDL